MASIIAVHVPACPSMPVLASITRRERRSLRVGHLQNPV